MRYVLELCILPAAARASSPTMYISGFLVAPIRLLNVIPELLPDDLVSVDHAEVFSVTISYLSSFVFRSSA
jgi:hypothetical protein